MRESLAVRAAGLEKTELDGRIPAGAATKTGATRRDGDMCGEVSAYVNLARHAVRCAGQRRSQSVA